MNSAVIKNIGKMRYKGIGANLYQNEDLTASIRFNLLADELPSNTALNFDSIEQAKLFIESKKGVNGLGTLLNIMDCAELND